MVKAGKKEPSLIERNPALGAVGRGFGAGAGVASIVALVREFLDTFDERKRLAKLKNPGVASDTVVLTVPKAEERDRDLYKLSSAYDSMIDAFLEDGSKTKELRTTQARNEDGTFASGTTVCDSGEKDAESGSGYNPTYLEGVGDTALGFAGGAVAAGTGYYLVSRVYDYIRKKRLQREVAAAQHEYIDSLSKAGSYTHPTLAGRLVSGVGDAMSSGEKIEEGSKQALGVAGGLALLVWAASSALTKKYMDKQFRESTGLNDPQPEVKKVIVKGASQTFEMSPIDALACTVFMAECFREPEMTKSAGWLQSVKGLASNDPYTQFDTVFAGMGMDPRVKQDKWTYGLPSAAGESEGGIGRFVSGLGDSIARATIAAGIQNNRDAYMKAIMDDRYAPQRERMTAKYVNDWYGNSAFGKSQLGQWLQKPFSWLSGMFGRMAGTTEWGKKLFADRLSNSLKDAAPDTSQPQQEPDEEAQAR